MREPTMADIYAEIRSLREVVLTLVKQDDRMVGRQELADRLGISTRTLAKRIEAGQVPAPVHGKWLLSEVIAWEKRLLR